MKRFGDIEVLEAGEFGAGHAPSPRRPEFSFGDAGSIEQNFGVVNNYAPQRGRLLSDETKSSAVSFINVVCGVLLALLLGLMVAFLILAFVATG